MTAILGPIRAADELLRFVWDQSYDKSFGEVVPKWTTTPDRAPGIDASVPPLPLDRELYRALDAVPYPVDWSRERKTAATPGDVQTLLYNTFGILRREPRNAYNDHRAFPSPRSLFPTHAYYLCRDAVGSRAFHYDPVGHALQPVSGCGPLTGDGVIVIATHFTHIPDYYRSLRYTLGLLEAGHALYTLELVAHSLRIATRVRHAFDDAALLATLRLQSEDGWALPVVVELGQGDWSLVTDALGADDPAAERADSSIDRSCWLRDAGERRAWTRVGAIAAPPVPPEDAVTLSDASTPAHASAAQVLFDRNAGRGAAGVSGVHCSIAQSVVGAALREGFRSIDADLTPRGSGFISGVRVLLVSERVTDLDDGLYEAFSARSVARLRSAPLMEEVQQAFPSALHLATYNLAWFFVVDYPCVIDTLGPRGFRVANLELGWIAQAIGCAVAAHGLFARPCRSFHEPVLDAVLGLSSTESVAYALLCGVNRFRDIRLDLRC